MTKDDVNRPLCSICGEPMPEGETVFKFHGYSGPCPKPPLEKKAEQPPYNLPFIAKRFSNEHTWALVDATYQVVATDLDEHEATWLRDKLND